MTHSFSEAFTMNNRKSKLKELFGEMSDFSDNESPPPRDRPPTPGKNMVVPPRVGTTVQRGDRETARWTAAMATPPPPPPAKRRTEDPAPLAKRSGPTSPRDVPAEPVFAVSAPEAAVDGIEGRPREDDAGGEWRLLRVRESERPAGSPPIRIILPTGRAVDIPFYAVHRSRKYKLRIAGERWIMRFDCQGRLSTCRRA